MNKKLFWSLFIILPVVSAFTMRFVEAQSNPTSQIVQKEDTTKEMKKVEIVTSPEKTPEIKSDTKVQVKTDVKKSETKPVAKKTVTVSTSVKWDKSGLKAIGSLASFDYQKSIRNAYMKKVENYAKRKGVKLITASVVQGMHE